MFTKNGDTLKLDPDYLLCRDQLLEMLELECDKQQQHHEFCITQLRKYEVALSKDIVNLVGINNQNTNINKSETTSISMNRSPDKYRVVRGTDMLEFDEESEAIVTYKQKKREDPTWKLLTPTSEDLVEGKINNKRFEIGFGGEIHSETSDEVRQDFIKTFWIDTGAIRNHLDVVVNPVIDHCDELLIGLGGERKMCKAYLGTYVINGVIKDALFWVGHNINLIGFSIITQNKLEINKLIMVKLE